MVPSSSYKVTLVAVSVLGAFFTSGIFYGYSGIVSVLVTQAKAFASTCLAGESVPCKGQIRALTAAFTVGVTSNGAGGMLIGILLDWAGPRWTTVWGCVAFAGGLISFAAAPLADALYYAGFFFLAVGGCTTFTAMMNFADLYPSVGSAIISAQNGAFDASSAVLFAMGKASTGYDVPLGTVMLMYLVVPLSLLVVAAAVFPDTPFGAASASESKPSSSSFVLPVDVESECTASKNNADGTVSTNGTVSSTTERTGGNVPGGATGTSSEAKAPLLAPGEGGEVGRVYRIKLAAINSAPSSTSPQPNPNSQPSRPPASSSSSGGHDLAEPLLSGNTRPEDSSSGNTEVSDAVTVLPGRAAPPLLPAIYNTDIRSQLSSDIFWVFTIVASYLGMRSNFFIASIYRQLETTAFRHVGPTFGDAAEAVAVADEYVDLFNYALPLGGALSVPIAGWVMVRLGLSSTFALIGTMCSVVSAIQAFGAVLPLEAQVVGFVVFSITRSFIFGALAAFVGQLFGFRNFGRIFGLSRIIAAAVTTLQYPLISFTEHTLGGNYTAVNIGFLVLEASIAILFPLYLCHRVFFGYFFIPRDPEPSKQTEHHHPSLQ